MTPQQLQSLRNLGNECEAAADEIDRLRAERDAAWAEIERLRAGGCARGQRSKQWCQEAECHTLRAQEGGR